MKKNNYSNRIIELSKRNKKSKVDDIEKEKRLGIIAGIITSIVILLLIFIISLIPSSKLSTLITFIIFGGPFLILILFAIYRRIKLIKNFYKIPKANEKINLKEVKEKELLIELYNDSAITFYEEPSEELLDFIYNWLNNLDILKEEKLNVYFFTGEFLNSVYKNNKYSNDYVFTSIFLKDLANEESKLIKLASEHFIVGSRWLDDVVNNLK